MNDPNPDAALDSLVGEVDKALDDEWQAMQLLIMKNEENQSNAWQHLLCAHRNLPEVIQGRFWYIARWLAWSNLPNGVLDDVTRKLDVSPYGSRDDVADRLARLYTWNGSGDSNEYESRPPDFVIKPIGPVWKIDYPGINWL